MVTGLVGFCWLLMKVSYHWSEYESSFKKYISALLMYVFAALYASSEAWAIGAEAGLRTFLIFLANVGLLHALFEMRTKYYAPRSEVRRPRH
jgi:hypothetical protein